MKKRFFVVAAVMISSQLKAQEQPAPVFREDTTARPLDEVVTIANKYPNKTSMTGKVLTVISREQLERSGGKDLSQILNEQAGIYISGSNSNPGKDKTVFLRGARAEHTLITIDGIPVYDPSGIGGNFDIRNLSIDNIERIEILKGSQSTLYGSDAIAGVINIISKKPAANTLNAYGVMSYGSNHTFRTNLGLSGRSGKFDYTLNQGYYDSQGINEATTSNGDQDEYRQKNFQASVGMQINGQVRIQPFFRVSQSIGDLDQGAFTDELDYTYNQKSLQTGIRNEFNIGKTKLNVIYNFNYTNRMYIDDSTESRNGFDIYSRGTYKGAEHFVDAYTHTSINEKIKLTTGMDFRRSHSDQEFFSVGFFGPFHTLNSRDSLNQNQLGIYAAINVNTKSGFNIEAGNRLNIHSEYGSHYVFNLNPSFLLNKKWKLFANFSSGFRTPSLYQLFSEYGNKDLRPESSFTGEGGVQFFSKDQKINSRVVLFSRNVKDVIFFYFNSSTFQSQYINQDTQKDHGLELESSFLIARHTTIKAFYSFVTGEINTKTGTKDTTYNNLLRRPKNSWGINIATRFSDRLYISTNIASFGKRKDAYFDAMIFETVNTVLKSYTLWDLYTEYHLLRKKLKIFVDLRNMTNYKYAEISGFNTLGFNGSGGVRFSL